MTVFCRAAVLASLAGCATAPGLRFDGGEAVVVSPFDLELGSAEYAKLLGDRLKSTTDARYDPQTKTTTTNWSWHARVKLAKPFMGEKRVGLTFKGEDRRLESFEINSLPHDMVQTMTMEECLKTFGEVSAELRRRLGIKPYGPGKRTVKELEAEIVKEHGKRAGREPNGCTFLRPLRGRNLEKGTTAAIFCSVDGNRKCGLGLRVSKDKSEPFLSRFGSVKERARAHDEAKKLRTAVKRLSGVDLDAPPDGGGSLKLAWQKLDKPVCGMTERRIAATSLHVQTTSLSFRRAYDGDVDEAEMERQARDFIEALERELGGTIPRKDVDLDGKKALAAVHCNGTPAYGDTRVAMQLDCKELFSGQIGDIAISVISAPPQYAKTSGGAKPVRRGAVVAMIVQSPMMLSAKAKR